MTNGVKGVLRDKGDAVTGGEQSGQMILSSMREIYRKHQKGVMAEMDSPDARKAWRRGHLSNSIPIVQMNHFMRTQVPIGSAARNV